MAGAAFGYKPNSISPTWPAPRSTSITTCSAGTHVNVNVNVNRYARGMHKTVWHLLGSQLGELGVDRLRARVAALGARGLHKAWRHGGGGARVQATGLERLGLGVGATRRKVGRQRLSRLAQRIDLRCSYTRQTSPNPRNSYAHPHTPGWRARAAERGRRSTACERKICAGWMMLVR